MNVSVHFLCLFLKFVHWFVFLFLFLFGNKFARTSMQTVQCKSRFILISICYLFMYLLLFFSYFFFPNSHFDTINMSECFVMYISDELLNIVYYYKFQYDCPFYTLVFFVIKLFIFYILYSYYYYIYLYLFSVNIGIFDLS
eukprot:514414_1